LNRLVVLFLVLAAVSCGRPQHSGTLELRNEVASAPVAPARSTAAQVPRVVALGDSITAGYGIRQTEAYPALLEKKLRENGYTFEVTNAGVSGDTSADGLRRLDWALDGPVQVLILALGGNDALRGLPPEQMKENLQRIITTTRQRGISVLLVGMEAPPNFGERYANEFRKVFRDLAADNHVPLVPFLLEGVAGIADLNQADGIHPTARGAGRIADLLWPPLEKIIQTGRTR
jgi:acyl-CoA thioesterase I